MRGHLEGLILASLERGTAHGWEIWRISKLRSGGALGSRRAPGLTRPCIGWRARASDLLPPRWEAATADRPGPRRRLSSDSQGPPPAGNGPRRVSANLLPFWESLGSTGMKALRVQVERRWCGRFGPAHSARIACERKSCLHLTRLHEQELARGGDEGQATAAALERFGDAASLCGELQDSVPWIERWACMPILEWMMDRRRVGESAIRYILRMNAWVFALSTGYYSLMMLVVVIARGVRQRVDQPTSTQLFILFAGLIIIQSLGLLGQGLLCEGIGPRLRPAYRRDRCPRAAGNLANRRLRGSQLGTFGHCMCRAAACVRSRPARSIDRWRAVLVDHVGGGRARRVLHAATGQELELLDAGISRTGTRSISRI